MTKRNSAPLAAAALGMALIAAAPSHAQNPAAHEHGVGQMNVSLDGRTLAVEYEFPSDDIVGFEHPAEAADDVAAVRRALDLLGDPHRVLDLPATAACTVDDADADTSLLADTRHGHDAKHEHK
ncbi:MAG: DUF2796 domain-containing protein, partial [Rhodospirillaceae bacterium]